ncbi:Mitochondrial aspartate-glutamate transporter AGC1 [Seminavis robusta]|uniref:Mitochondrial aspartate-glutamate transporter AGC1 n=1 Tax=Seminavis robusta TaxID=568900 RepID=A0A9N8EMR0_9STRA|nr:Mitochondrial aspartate-glutamate transporter AGC1 [Seminavis robusta]|eukprot:Sro1273_g258350.1 Mitochondrial aspartate-glutamate transporter AGC1 (1044) ;mRNA; f:26307-29608
MPNNEEVDQSGAEPSRFDEARRFLPKEQKDEELIRLALHKNSFFTCLDEEQVQRFIQVAEVKRYSAGETIILEGCVDEFEVDQDVSVEQDGVDNNENIQGIEDPAGTDETPISEEGFVLVESAVGAGTEEGEDSQPMHPKERLEQEGLITTRPPQSATSTVDSSDDDSEQERIRLPLQEPTKDDSTLDNRNPKADREIPFPPPIYTSSQDDNLEPPPPRSGVPSYIYIVRSGQADVLYSQNVNPASLGTGTVFGEGGFLFGRQHSASVVAAENENMECFVVDAATFRNFVLPSDNMTKLYQRHARHVDNETNTRYMTMQDFVRSCLEPLRDVAPSSEQEREEVQSNGLDASNVPIQDPLDGVRIANIFYVLRNNQAHQHFRSFSKLEYQKISLADFCLFHLLMARPDPEVDITFLLIDERKRGVIYKEDLAKFLTRSSLVDSSDFTFDMDSEFIARHFGGGKHGQQSKQRGIRQQQFSQFMVDLRREIGQQIFLQEVQKNGTPEGYLPPAGFVRVLKKACGWRVPQGVANRLETIYQMHPSDKNEMDDNHQESEDSTEAQIELRRPRDHYFSYCDFLAYQDVLGQLSGICNLIDRAETIKKGPVSVDDFKVANRVLGMGGQLSRRQVEIIFQLFDLNGDGFVSHEDTVAVAGDEFSQRIDAVAGRQGVLTFAPPPKYNNEAGRKSTESNDVLTLLQNFSLTSIAGCIGVFALAPLDLVKTRLMNERVALNGPRMYQGSVDCLRVAMVSEGYSALYRGLLPQLIGVAPEKAIKLVVNDLLHQSLGVGETDQKRTATHFLKEMLAGGCAGACQLLVTNPTEIVKIRMQLQGETARLLRAKGYDNPVPQSLQAVVRNLGYSGLFMGARACLLRDIPFGAIYFPTYSFLKESFSSGPEDTSPSTSATNLLLAGTIAGVPASFLTTPADVIKTRLQAIPRPGEAEYAGIRDCFTKVYNREGPAAFFKGWGMRVARISPQFGISLVAYEQLSQLLGAKGFLPPTTVPVNPKDYWEAFPTRAIKSKSDDTDRLLKNLGANSLRPGGPWNN